MAPGDRRGFLGTVRGGSHDGEVHGSTGLTLELDGVVYELRRFGLSVYGDWYPAEDS